MRNLRHLVVEAFKTYFANFSAILLIVLPIALPVEWIKNYCFADIDDSFWTTMRRNGLVELLFLSVTTPILILFFHRKKAGEPGPMSGIFIQGLRKWPKIILYGIVKSVVVTAGLIFFVIPGILFYFRLFFLDIVVTLEDTKRENPLTRSSTISKGNLIPIIASAAIVALFVNLPPLLLSYPLYGLIALVWYDALWLGDTLIDLWVDLTSPLYLLLGLILYKKITEMRAQAPDAEPARSEA